MSTVAPLSKRYEIVRSTAEAIAFYVAANMFSKFDKKMSRSCATRSIMAIDDAVLLSKEYEEITGVKVRQIVIVN